MGEIAINPIHNVHKKYRTMNFVNPYFFAPPVDLSTNTEIGGIASTISTPALLATKLGIDVSRITNFTIVGSNIKCRIVGSYVIPSYAFQYEGSPSFATPPCTYYNDIDGLVTYLGADTFKSHSLKWVYFKSVTGVGISCFTDGSGNIRDYVYIPNCTNLGGTPSDDSVFIANFQTRKIYCHPSLATNNAGGEDGDIAYARSKGSIISYVTNFTAPNPITTLTAGTIFNTAIQLNFTPPSSTNAIDYYDLYLNGILQAQRITTSGQYITGLTPSTNYDITLKAVDIFYNKSVVSNTLNVSTTNNANDIIKGLVSYYKLDSNSNDSFGSNNGTDTSVSYVAGKVGNAGSFNGTTSKIAIASSSFDFYGTQNITFNCWVKLNSLTNNEPLSIQQVGSAGIKDKSIQINSNGSCAFYGYDGGAKTALSSAGLITTGNWYMLTGVYDGTNLKIYLNGVLRATTACSSTYNFTSPQLTFGNSTVGVLNGLLDEVAIYNTALTQTEIDLLYNSGNGTTL